jgi:hypothetical protein
MAKKRNRSLSTPDDTPEMRTAVAWCSLQGLPVRRVSDHQIKVGSFNLWPGKGTWNHDEMPQKRPGGFPAFKKAVLAWWKPESRGDIVSIETASLGD